MYVPAAFQQPDRQQQFALMRAHSFALLVSQLHGEPVATHLPLLVAEDLPPAGHLIGHLARANPQWRELAGSPVLAIFSGPHAYVSPTWYGKQPMVPTWNYLAVHVYGRCELIEDQAELIELLARTVSIYESKLPAPWSFAADDAFVPKLLKGIVGFRVVIDRIEAKWKLGQNHAQEVRASAASHLEQSTDPAAREIAALMRAAIPKAD